MIGIDIVKNSFHVVGLDGRGAVALRQKWSRGQVEARLANINADYRHFALEFLRHSVLLCLRCPLASFVAAGLEHGRTIPLPEVERPILL